MRLAIHILGKDARRLWPNLALVGALTALLAVRTPQSSPLYGAGIADPSRMLEYLQLLLPVAWWFTIARLVHGEHLVGDRQFWVTRPYSWKSLLAAKLLFCVVFLILPFLACDCVILARCGFSPTGLIGELLWRQCSLACLLILPPLVLAVLTRGTRQFLLACIGIVIAVLTVATLLPSATTNVIVEAMRHADDSRTVAWLREWTGVILYAGGVMALVLWQYARRRTGAGRAIAIALFASTVASSAWPTRAIAQAPAGRPAIYRDRFPELAVTFAPQLRRALRGNPIPRPAAVPITIPVELTGRNRDLLDWNLASIQLTPEAGEAWSSGWAWDTWSHIEPGADWIDVQVPRPVFERLNRGPVRLQAVLGVVIYERETAAKARAGGGWTMIPGFGSVTVSPDPRANGLWMRAPLRQARQKLVYTVHGSDVAEPYHGQWVGFYPTDSSMHISPVATNWAAMGTDGPFGRLKLPNTAEVEIDVERPIDLVRRDLLIPAIRLGDYAAPTR